MTRPLRPLTTVFAICLAFTLNAANKASAEERLRLTGSSTVAPVMQEITKMFEDGRDVRTFVETGGSSKGINDLRKGLSNVAMISRALAESETELTAHTIARDGIAALAHSDVPLDVLSPDQLRAIFTGTVDNWSELGGPDQAVVVISKGEGSATSVVFNTFLGLTADKIEGDIVAAENAQMIKTVSVTPGSIGYVSIGAAIVDIEFGTPIKLLALGDVPATLENVANGSYQATRPLSLVTMGEMSAGVADLIDFSKPAAVSEIITDLSYTPVTP
ncbi:phosphate ABC transporter substrate-binding protein [Tateyamaria sp.]|uniref:phosphate ABC transporter substrate-binding protein n=1 Tax=Tateyamaria sp. TaxID=1929288 RepID=UPI003B20BA0D